MMKLSRVKASCQVQKIWAIFLSISLTLSQSLSYGQVAASFAVSEVKVLNTFQLDLPPDLGTIETLLPGAGPTIIHIQTAHGNYEAQKKIQAILHHLNDQYGLNLLLLEGSASKLNPEMLRFFPQRPDLTMRAAEELTQEALVKGDELFMLEEPKAQAYGIENIKAYRKNRGAFKNVIIQKEKTEVFLQDMDIQIDRLTGAYLSKDLRTLLKRFERFETNQIPLRDWLIDLKAAAKKYSEIDLEDPAYQIDWPMLMRIYKLEEFESRLNLTAFAGEKNNFLKAIHGIPKNSYQEIEKLFSSPLSRNPLPDPETGLLFENMAAFLPPGFDFSVFPNVAFFIGHLILQSELKGDRLLQEEGQLTDKLFAVLAKTQREKKILRILKDYRLLKKLFALELTPQDYEQILQRGDSIRPSKTALRFQAVNKTQQVKDIQFKHMKQIEILFEEALEFYQGAKGRDKVMLENILQRLKETGASKAVVITGGFHSEPFKRFFQTQGYSYALISPRMTSAEGREAYLEAVLQDSSAELTKSTMDLPRRMEPLDIQRRMGENISWVNKRVRLARLRILYEDAPAPRSEVRTAEPTQAEIDLIVQDLGSFNENGYLDMAAEKRVKDAAGRLRDLFDRTSEEFIEKKLIPAVQMLNPLLSDDGWFVQLAAVGAIEVLLEKTSEDFLSRHLQDIAIPIINAFSPNDRGPGSFYGAISLFSHVSETFMERHYHEIVEPFLRPLAASDDLETLGARDEAFIKLLSLVSKDFIEKHFVGLVSAFTHAFSQEYYFTALRGANGLAALLSRVDEDFIRSHFLEVIPIIILKLPSEGDAYDAPAYHVLKNLIHQVSEKFIEEHLKPVIPHVINGLKSLNRSLRESIATLELLFDRVSAPFIERNLKEAIPGLVLNLRNEDLRIRAASARALQSALSRGSESPLLTNLPEAIPLLISNLSNSDRDVRLDSALALLLSSSIEGIDAVNQKFNLGLDASHVVYTNRLLRTVSSELQRDFSFGAEQYVKQWIYLKLRSGMSADRVEQILNERLLPGLRIYEAVQSQFPMTGIETIQTLDSHNEAQIERSILLSNYFMLVATPGGVGIQRGSQITESRQEAEATGEIRILPAPYSLLTQMLDQYLTLRILPQNYGYHTSIEGELGKEALPVMMASFFMDTPPDLLQPFLQEEGYLSFFGIHQSYVGATVNPRPGPDKGRVAGTQTNIYDKVVFGALVDQLHGNHPYGFDLERKGLLAAAAYALLKPASERTAAETELAQAFRQFKENLQKFYSAINLSEAEQGVLTSWVKKSKEQPEPVQKFYQNLENLLNTHVVAISEEEAQLLAGNGEAEYFKKGHTPRELNFDVIAVPVLKFYAAMINPNRLRRYQETVQTEMQKMQAVYTRLYPVSMRLSQTPAIENLTEELLATKADLLSNLFSGSPSHELEAARLLRFVDAPETTTALRARAGIDLATPLNEVTDTANDPVKQMAIESLRYLQDTSNESRRSEVRTETVYGRFEFNNQTFVVNDEGVFQVPAEESESGSMINMDPAVERGDIIIPSEIVSKLPHDLAEAIGFEEYYSNPFGGGVIIFDQDSVPRIDIEESDGDGGWETHRGPLELWDVRQGYVIRRSRHRSNFRQTSVTIRDPKLIFPTVPPQPAAEESVIFAPPKLSILEQVRQREDVLRRAQELVVRLRQAQNSAEHPPILAQITAWTEDDKKILREDILTAPKTYLGLDPADPLIDALKQAARSEVRVAEYGEFQAECSPRIYSEIQIVKIPGRTATRLSLEVESSGVYTYVEDGDNSGMGYRQDVSRYINSGDISIPPEIVAKLPHALAEKFGFEDYYLNDTGGKAEIIYDKNGLPRIRSTDDLGGHGVARPLERDEVEKGFVSRRHRAGYQPVVDINDPELIFSKTSAATPGLSILEQAKHRDRVLQQAKELVEKLKQSPEPFEQAKILAQITAWPEADKKILREDILTAPKTYFDLDPADSLIDALKQAVRSEVRAQTLEDSLANYYEGKIKISQAYADQDRSRYQREIEAVEQAAREAKQYVEKGANLQQAVEKLKALKNYPADLVGDWDEILYAVGGSFSKEQREIVEQSVKTILSHFASDTEKERLYHEIVGQTLPLSLRSLLPSIGDTSVSLLQENFFSLMSRLTSSRALGFIKNVPSGKQIVMISSAKPLLFRAGYLHEVIHYLAALGLIPISWQNELLTQAVTVAEIMKGGGIGEIQEWASAKGSPLVTFLIETGMNLARQNKPLFRVERLLSLAQEALMEGETWKIFGFPSRETVAQMQPHELERWAGPILGGYAFENERKHQVPILDFLFNFARVNLALPGERQLTGNEQKALEELIRAESDWVRRVTQIPQLQVRPWRSIYEVDHPQWRLVKELEELHFVPEDLIRLSTEAARGKFMQESLRPLYGVPFEIAGPEFSKNGPFRALFSAIETPLVVEKGTKKWGGVKSWVERYYQEAQEVRDAEIAKIEMARKPAYLQFTEGILFYWIHGSSDPRMVHPEVLKRLKAAEVDLKRAWAAETHEAFYAAVKKIWTEHYADLVKIAEEELKAQKLFEGMLENLEIQISFDPKDLFSGRAMPISMLPENLQKKIMEKVRQKLASMSAEELKQLADEIHKQMQDMENQFQRGQGGKGAGAAPSPQPSAGENPPMLPDLRYQAPMSLEEIEKQLQQIEERLENLERAAEKIEGTAGTAKESAEKLAHEAQNLKEGAGVSDATQQQVGDLNRLAHELQEGAQDLHQQTQQAAQDSQTTKVSADKIRGGKDADALKEKIRSLWEKISKLEQRTGQFEGRAKKLETDVQSTGEEALKTPPDTDALKQKSRGVESDSNELAGEAGKLKENTRDIRQQTHELTEAVQRLSQALERLENGQGEDSQSQDGPAAPQSEASSSTQGGYDKTERRDAHEAARPVGSSKPQAVPVIKEPASPKDARPKEVSAAERRQQEQKSQDDRMKEALMRLGFDKEAAELYVQYRRPIASLIHRNREFLLRIRQSKESRQIVRGRSTGLLDPKALFLIPTGEEKLFYKKIDPNKDKDMISIAVDASGSMAGDNLEYAIQLAILDMESLLGHEEAYESEVFAFSDDPYYAAKTYEEPMTPRVVRNATYQLATEGGGGTNDLGAIKAAIERMKDRGGQMEEIRIFAIGVGPGTEYVEKAYGFGRGIHIDDPKEILTKANRVIERELQRAADQGKKLRLILVITDGGSGVGLEQEIPKIYREVRQMKGPRSEVRMPHVSDDGSQDPFPYREVSRFVDSKGRKWLLKDDPQNWGYYSIGREKDPPENQGPWSYEDTDMSWSVLDMEFISKNHVPKDVIDWLRKQIPDLTFSSARFGRKGKVFYFFIEKDAVKLGLRYHSPHPILARRGPDGFFHIDNKISKKIPPETLEEIKLLVTDMKINGQIYNPPVPKPAAPKKSLLERARQLTATVKKAQALVYRLQQAGSEETKAPIFEEVRAWSDDEKTILRDSILTAPQSYLGLEKNDPIIRKLTEIAGARSEVRNIQIYAAETIVSSKNAQGISMIEVPSAFLRLSDRSFLLANSQNNTLRRFKLETETGVWTAKKAIKSVRDAQGIETIHEPQDFLRLSGHSFLLANAGNETLRRFELENGLWAAKESIQNVKDVQGIDTISYPRNFLRLSDESFLLANAGNETLRRFELENGLWAAKESIRNVKDVQEIDTISWPRAFLRLSDKSFLLANKGRGAFPGSLRRFEFENGVWTAKKAIKNVRDAQGIETIYDPQTFLRLSGQSFLLANAGNDTLRRFELENGLWVAKEAINVLDTRGYGAINYPEAFLRLSDESFFLANSEDDTLRLCKISGANLPIDDEDGFKPRKSLIELAKQFDTTVKKAQALVYRLQQAGSEETKAPIFEEVRAWSDDEKTILRDSILTASQSYLGLEKNDPIIQKLIEIAGARSEVRALSEDDVFHFPELPDEETPDNLEKIWRAIGGQPWMLGRGGARVPQDVFIPPTPTNLKNLTIMLHALFNGSSPENIQGMDNNLFLWGEEGVAKTKMGLFLARLAHQPVRYVAINADTDRMELIERPFYGEEARGETGWAPSELIEGMEAGDDAAGGDWVFVDEINKGKPGVLKSLNGIAQNRRRTVRDHKNPTGYRTVYAKPRFRLIAMANPPKGQYKDVKLLSGDLTSRFIEHTITWLPPEEEKRVLRYDWPADDPEKEEVIRKLVDLAVEIRKDYESDIATVERPISTRSLQRIVRHLNQFPRDKKRLRELFFRSYYVDDQDEVVRAFLSADGQLFSRIGISKDKQRKKIAKSEFVEKGNEVKAKYWKVGEAKMRVKDGPPIEIPPDVLERLKRFRETPQTLTYLEAILKDIVLGENIYLVGDAGTGKNILAWYLAWKLNWPLELHEYDEEMDAKDVLLMPHVKDQKTGTTESQLILAMRKGSIYFADEATAARPGVLAVWNNPLQFGWIDLWNGNRVRKDPAFIFMAASNQPRPPYLVNKFSAELVARFSVHYIDYLPEDEEIEQLQPYGPNVPHEIITRLVKAAGVLRKKYRDPNESERLPRPIDRRTLEKAVSQFNLWLKNSIIEGPPSLINIFDRSLKFHEPEYQKIVADELRRQKLDRDNLARLLLENWSVEEQLDLGGQEPVRQFVLKDRDGKEVARGETSAEEANWGTWEPEKITRIVDVDSLARYHQLAGERKIIVRVKAVNVDKIKPLIEIANEAKELSNTASPQKEAAYTAFKEKLEQFCTAGKLTLPVLLFILRQTYVNADQREEIQSIAIFLLKDIAQSEDAPRIEDFLQGDALPPVSMVRTHLKALIEQLGVRSEVRMLHIADYEDEDTISTNFTDNEGNSWHLRHQLGDPIRQWLTRSDSNRTANERWEIYLDVVYQGSGRTKVVPLKTFPSEVIDWLKRFVPGLQQGAAEIEEPDKDPPLKVSILAMARLRDAVLKKTQTVVDKLKSSDKNQRPEILAEVQAWPQEEKQILREDLLTAPQTYFSLESSHIIVTILQEAARSELRPGQTLNNHTTLEVTAKTLNPETLLLFKGPRAKILPIRFEAYGADFLVRVLTELLKRPVYSERAGIAAPVLKSHMTQTLGKGRVMTTPQFQSWIHGAASDQGRVLLDKLWLERLLNKSPRALYILLTALQKFQEDREVSEPLLLVTGEKEKILKQIQRALSRKENGLTWEEAFEARNFLLPQIQKLIQVILPGELNGYIETHDYGVATLLPFGSESLTELPLGAQFMLDPSRVADQDLVTLAFIVPALLKAAALVKGIKKSPAEQIRILKPYLQQILPGTIGSKVRGFVIELGQYIQQVMIKDHLVDVAA